MSPSPCVSGRTRPAQPPPRCTSETETRSRPGTYLHWVGREVAHEIGFVRVVHHGHHGEGVSSKPKKLVNILLGRDLIARGHFAADFIIGCRRKENKKAQTSTEESKTRLQHLVSLRHKEML